MRILFGNWHGAYRSEEQALEPDIGRHLVIRGHATDAPRLDHVEGEDEDEARIYEFTLRVPSGRRDASDYLHLSFFEPLVPWHERRPEWLHMMQEGTLVEVTPPHDSISMLMDADGHLRDPGVCLMAMRVRVFVPEAM